MTDTDDRIRTLLREAMVPVDEGPEARRETMRRAARARQRPRPLRLPVAAAAAASAAAVVAAVVWAIAPSGVRAPLIAPAPPSPAPASPDPATTPGSGCADLDVSAETDAFLDTWTEPGAAGRSELCVLRGVHGPPPEFDTAPLGPEQALQPGDLPDEPDVAASGPSRESVEGYPVVHVGRIGDSDRHTYLRWGYDRTRAPVACVEGVCVAGEHPADHTGVFGTGVGGGTMTMTVWVPPQASAVALEIGGEPVLWTRPVALVAPLLVDSYRPVPGRTYRVVVFDRHGDRIAVYDGELLGN